MIFDAGTMGDAMYIIQQGEVEILRPGREQERLALLEEGDFFGETALLEDMPRVASARAVTDCELLRIDSSVFDQMVRHNPEIPVRMLRKLAKRLRNLIEGEIDAVVLEAPVSAPAVPPPLPQMGAPSKRMRLVHKASGTELVLNSDGETHLGRFDSATGTHPDIELTPFDPEHTTSRRHARIISRSGQVFVREEIGVPNGTFVNKSRIATGIETQLYDGDELQFGKVKLTLQLS